MTVTTRAWGLTLLLSAPALAQPITVTSAADSGPGTLRSAILQAEANRPVHDVIVFSIGGGPSTITLLSPLSPLTDPAGVTIDGFTEPGAGPGANPPATAVVLIEIDGQLAGSADGLLIQSDDNVIQGLSIHGFQRDGIRIVGGIANPTANRNRIHANFVGTDASGILGRGNGTTMTGFQAGIHVGNVSGGMANDNVVDGNLVSDNWTEGIWFEGPRQPGDVGFNVASDNFVGTDVTGTVDLGNRHEGIALTEGTHDNRVTGNLVSGNDFEGIGLQGFSNAGLPLPPIQTTRNLLARNTVGLDINLNPLPNSMHGIAIGQYGLVRWGCADFNTISDNVIAHNGGDGIAVVEDGVNTINGDHNEIRRNAIWLNAGLGIDLSDDGVTGNDPGDPDNNANQQLNFPVIQSVQYATITTIQGVLDTTVASQAAVEVFLVRADSSGNGEGQWYLGSTTPDALGNWSFVTNRPAPSDRITATATDAMSNTSEFAANAVVPGSPSLTASWNTVANRLGGGINLGLSAGASNGNGIYVIAGSLSGTIPGTPLGSVVVPLNRDSFTSLVLSSVNTPTFVNFLGTLDGSGNTSAQLNMPPLPSVWNGVLMHFAYVVAPFHFASNPVAVELVGW